MIKNKLICFLPFFINESGHEISFIYILKKISKKINKDLILVLPKKNFLKLKGFDNEKILNLFSFFKYPNIFNFFKNIFQIYLLLKKRKINYRDSVYIDGYNFLFLISFLLSTIFLRKKISLIIYCRYNFIGIKKKIFFLILKLLSKFTHKISILTDTINLKKIYKKETSLKTILMPIPHTFKKKNNSLILNNKKIKLFFPGQLRKDKFNNNFNHFLKLNNSGNFDIYINNRFQNNFKIKNKIIKFSNNLSRNNYLKIFSKINVVVLPYEEIDYKHRSSGIFIESISLNKTTLVTNKTWMSSELRKFKLDDFIINKWKSFYLIKNLKNIFNYKNQKKLLSMQKKYLSFHNENNFVKIFSKII